MRMTKLVNWLIVGSGGIKILFDEPPFMYRLHIHWQWRQENYLLAWATLYASLHIHWQWSYENYLLAWATLYASFAYSLAMES